MKEKNKEKEDLTPKEMIVEANRLISEASLILSENSLETLTEEKIEKVEFLLAGAHILLLHLEKN